MKKVILALLILVLMSGCVKIDDASIDELIESTMNSKYNLYNHQNKGFKYYLPRELYIEKDDEYNEIIKSKYYDYYLYVDLVRYFNNMEETFVEDSSLYYSKVFEFNDKKGSLNIKTLENDEYLIRARYNYATIQAKVKEQDINSAVTNMLVIISSIQYNNDVIKNLLEEDRNNSLDEQVNVFDDNLTDDDYLDVEVEYEEDEEEYNPDMIN